jgi:hypothetical protein
MVVAGNGLSDVVIGGPTNGVSYFLTQPPLSRVALMSVQDLQFIETPAYSYDFSGRSVSNAGDVNGDGYDDLIIGVPYAARCYVMFGTKHGFVNMTEGFTIFGINGDMTGWSVSGAGDVNNDTFADVIIGAPGAQNSVGTAYLVFGGHHTTDIETSVTNDLRYISIRGGTVQDHFGLSVSEAGTIFFVDFLLSCY